MRLTLSILFMLIFTLQLSANNELMKEFNNKKNVASEEIKNYKEDASNAFHSMGPLFERWKKQDINVTIEEIKTNVIKYFKPFTEKVSKESAPYIEKAKTATSPYLETAKKNYLPIAEKYADKIKETSDSYYKAAEKQIEKSVENTKD